MINQPALQESSGTIWMVVGGLFLLAALVPLAALIFAGSGRSAGVAMVVSGLVIACYVVLLGARVVVTRRRVRLRTMAACMLTMAGVSLLGLVVCAILEWMPQR